MSDTYTEAQTRLLLELEDYEGGLSVRVLDLLDAVIDERINLRLAAPQVPAVPVVCAPPQDPK